MSSTQSLPWIDMNGGQRVRIVEPQRTMGGWLLCANAEGNEYFIPPDDLRKADSEEAQP